MSSIAKAIQVGDINFNRTRTVFSNEDTVFGVLNQKEIQINLANATLNESNGHHSPSSPKSMHSSTQKTFGNTTPMLNKMEHTGQHVKHKEVEKPMKEMKKKRHSIALKSPKNGGLSPCTRGLKGWEVNEITVEKPKKHVIGTSNFMIKSP